jgi:pimeloyl-ACP methyl ester carboxylesterase
MLAALVAAGCCVLALALCGPAAAQTPSFLRACGGGFSCGHVEVPLDRSGSLPGTLQLALKVHPPLTKGPVTSALVALAGGPGQGASGFAQDFLFSYGPALRSREVVVFDQRGTGHSGALACKGMGVEQTPLARREAAARCADKLGPARAFYTTRDSADDIESIRQALGVDKLVVAGTSYGTKVALAYAKRYPQHVESLVLDSVVPLDEDTFMLPTFRRIPFMLRDNCSFGACHGITGSPVRDMATLVRRVDRGGFSGTYVRPNGKRARARMNEEDLVNTVIAADLDPTVLADLPGAVKAATRGDRTPILRVLARANAGDAETPPEIFSDALQFATVCEETPMPWPRTAPIADRPKYLDAALAQIPDSELYPFTRISARSAVEDCLLWPETPQAPDIGGGALPDVPVLIYSGRDDVRTPLSQAQSVAAQFPHSTLVQVPFTGHSVLTSDPSLCSSRALHDFFADRPVKQCGRGFPFLLPSPVPPRSFGAVHGMHGVPHGAGPAVNALRLTLADATTATIAASFVTGPSARVAVGGLRAGRADGIPVGRMKLHGYTYVPGVRVSGSVSLVTANGRLTVSGPRAASGTVRIKDGRVSGVLAGVRLQRVRIAQVIAASGRAGREITPQQVRRLLRLAAVRASARR